jgi:hypothetical protein
MQSLDSAPRFYFRYGVPVDRAKFRAIFIIVSSLLLVALVDLLVVRAVSAVSLIAGVWLFLRPTSEEPWFYVELEDRHVVINALWKRRIPYNIISKAEYRRYNSGDLGRSFANTLILLGRIGGSDFKPLGRRGETDRESTQLTFDRLRWMFVPIPPFVWPKREWLLPVSEPERLIEEVNKRLRP